MKSRGTYVSVDVRNYVDNLEFFRTSCAPSKVMPVVKANAYGHGAVVLAKAAERAGFDFFAAAFLEEAVELRNSGIESDILVLNYVSPDMIYLAEEKRITITLYSFQQLEKYKDLAYRPKAHLKIDTGMRRIGVQPEETKEFYEKARKLGFTVEGAYTHLSVADDLRLESREFTEKQIERFLKSCPRVPIKHVCNSSGAITIRDKHFDYVRIGIASYGLQPLKDKYVEQLKPVLSWKTIVSHVKWIKKGESLSYGRTFIAPHDMKVATVPVGYADGYWRNLSNRGEVLIQGSRCRVVGTVCMDQFLVDVTHLESVSVGDEVVLIGEQKDERITVERIAELVGTTNYEVVCRISSRVPRVYVNLDS